MAEIIEDELVVGDAGVARQQCLDALGAQRLGGDLVGADRQDASRQSWFQRVDVGVAGQH